MQTVSILMADDDADDRYLMESAFEECQLTNPLYFVKDGVELFDFLLFKGEYQNAIHPLPGLILLDLNMPRKDGREALKEIKNHPVLKVIPVLILTTSRSEDEIFKTYIGGANCFISKPTDFKEVLNLVRSIKQFWLETARIPMKFPL